MQYLLHTPAVIGSLAREALLVRYGLEGRTVTALTSVNISI